MSRRARVSICGYHHVYNRGVAKNKIFLNDSDKEKFLELLVEVSRDQNLKFNPDPYKDLMFIWIK